MDTNLKLRRVLAVRLHDLMQSTVALDTQAKLSKAADMTQSSVGRFLKGEVAATLDAIEKLSDAFGVPPGDLLQMPDADAKSTTLEAQIKDLPTAERRKVFDYAQYIIEKYSQENTATLFSKSTIIAPSYEDSEAIKRALLRTPSPLSNMEPGDRLSESSQASSGRGG
jgi:transcriptional regulator with XRE-family HTH domain